MSEKTRKYSEKRSPNSFFLDLFEDTRNKMIVSDTWKTFILTIMKLIIYL